MTSPDKLTRDIDQSRLDVRGILDILDNTIFMCRSLLEVTAMSTLSNFGGFPTGSFQPDAGGASAVIDERRNAPRLHESLPMRLTGVGCSKEHGCTTTDIGESGLYVKMAGDCGVDVGQRCELHFPEETKGSQLSEVAGESRYATVVRTELLKHGADKLVGVGLRFDRPMYL